MVARSGFPYRSASVPSGVEVPPKEPTTGAHYDTEWARTPVARVARSMIVNGPLRMVIGGLADPDIAGCDRLEDLRSGHETQPAIFIANHHSHLDAPLMITSIPRPWRDKLVVGAAADYFFASRVTGSASALALGAIPIDRTTVNRRSSDLAADLIADGWSLLVFPEGGRSPDGWGQPFKGGAAFLSQKTGAPVVPVHIDGTGAIFGKGAKRLKPGRTRITFGSPTKIRDGENVRRFNERLEASVAVLGDEAVTDWYTARLRAGAGRTPTMTGPEYSGWRRAWSLTDERAKGRGGQRRRQKRRWPRLS